MMQRLAQHLVQRASVTTLGRSLCQEMGHLGPWHQDLLQTEAQLQVRVHAHVPLKRTRGSKPTADKPVVVLAGMLQKAVILARHVAHDVHTHRTAPEGIKCIPSTSAIM